MFSSANSSDDSPPTITLALRFRSQEINTATIAGGVDKMHVAQNMSTHIAGTVDKMDVSQNETTNIAGAVDKVDVSRNQTTTVEGAVGNMDVGQNEQTTISGVDKMQVGQAGPTEIKKLNNYAGGDQNISYNGDHGNHDVSSDDDGSSGESMSSDTD